MKTIKSSILNTLADRWFQESNSPELPEIAAEDQKKIDSPSHEHGFKTAQQCCARDLRKTLDLLSIECTSE